MTERTTPRQRTLRALWLRDDGLGRGGTGDSQTSEGQKLLGYLIDERHQSMRKYSKFKHRLLCEISQNNTTAKHLDKCKTRFPSKMYIKNNVTQNTKISHKNSSRKSIAKNFLKNEFSYGLKNDMRLFSRNYSVIS